MVYSALVTGATGYLASHLLNDLGYSDLLLLDRTFKEGRITLDKASFQVIEQDLSQNPKIVSSNFETLIHAAFVNNNEAELEFLRQIPTNTYVIFFSTAAVYGEGLKHSTQDQAEPINEYGRNKLELENYISENFPKHLILRIANPYGKEFGIKGFYQIAKNKFAKSEKLQLNCTKPGELVRDFMTIDDFVSKVKELITKKAQGIYNISSGQGQSLEEFLAKELPEFDSNMIEYTGLRENEIKTSVLV